MAAAEGTPGITVVIPVLNERDTLGGCLDAIAEQDVDMRDVEVLICDGGSTDGTLEIAASWIASGAAPRARIVHSMDGTRPGNLNTGLREARGRVVCRVDARSRIPPHYLRRCAELLAERDDVSVVGGRQRSVSAGPSVIAAGIARALNNRWATGFSTYRRAAHSGPSDTVYLGAFRTAQLRAAGGWRGGLPVNEDFDLNRRMAQCGVVWFDASLVVDYVPRPSLRALLAQYIGFGRAKVRYWSLTGDRPRPRQIAMLAAPPLLLAGFTVAMAATPVPVRLACLVGCAVGATVMEVAGSHSPRSSLRAHLAALAAIACIAGGWLLGAWSELARALFSVRRRKVATVAVGQPPC